MLKCGQCWRLFPTTKEFYSQEDHPQCCQKGMFLNKFCWIMPAGSENKCRPETGNLQ